MDTIHIHRAPTNMDSGQNVLTRKEIRRQKLMEYLAAKANLKLPGKKTNLGKDEVVKSDRSEVKGVMDKENKIPALKKDTKDETAQSMYTVKRLLGLKNTDNICTSKLCEKQKSKSISTINKEPKAPKMPVFSNTHTVVNPKVRLNVVSKKPPFTGVQSANPHAVAHAPTAKDTAKICANASVKKSLEGRMIHGPIIKTRTGLTPAVLQPKNSKSRIFTTANDAKPSTNRAQSSSASHRPASQASNKSLRKTMSANVIKPLRESTVTLIDRGTKYLKQTQNSKLSNRPQISTRSTKSVRPELNLKSSKTKANDSHFQSQPNINKSKPSQANVVTTMRDNVKANKIATVSSGAGNSRVPKDTQKVTAPPLKPICAPVTSKQKKMPLGSQTAPQPPRSMNFTKRPTDMKTQGRAPPSSVQKTLTAAEDRIKKLQEWREAKGISYKRPPMFVKTQTRRTIAVPQPFWSNMEQEDEAHSLISAVDRSLADCMKLLGEGCPTHQVKEVLSRLPAVAQKFANYWICQARLMEQDGNMDVLPMFEKAVGLVVEPIDELRTVVFEILKKRDESQEGEKEAEEAANSIETSPETSHDSLKTPKPTRALICAEKGNSSVVKYKITATPGGPPSQRRDSTIVNGQEVRFFTPVRRSVRIERASLQYPVSLQDHDLCVTSYNDLIAEEEKETIKQNECGPAVTGTPLYIYRENDALKDKVSVEYVSHDE